MRHVHLSNSQTGPGQTAPRRSAYLRWLLAGAFAASLALPFLGGAPTTASAAESQDGLIHMTLTPGESEARYIMTVKLAIGQPKQAACVTKAVSGEIVMTPEGAVVPELSKISLDQRTLKCESPLTDSRAQQLLQTAQHPMAEFSVKDAPGLGAPLPTGDATFQLIGDQSVHGVSQPTTYDTTATLTPDSMVGTARALLKMTSFGITPPENALYQVSDDMVAEVKIKASLAGNAGAATDPAANDPAAAAAEPTP
jgi:hypothetical protein